MHLAQGLAAFRGIGVPALKQFAKRLKSYWRGILSRVRWPMHTGQLEGILTGRIHDLIAPVNRCRKMIGDLTRTCLLASKAH